MWWFLAYCVWIVIYYHLLYDETRGRYYTPYRRMVSVKSALSPLAFLIFCVIHLARVCWYIGGFVIFTIKAVGLAIIMLIQITGDVVGREVTIGTDSGGGLKEFPPEAIKNSCVLFEPELMVGEQYDRIYDYFNVIGVLVILVAVIGLLCYMEGL